MNYVKQCLKKVLPASVIKKLVELQTISQLSDSSRQEQISNDLFPTRAGSQLSTLSDSSRQEQIFNDLFPTRAGSRLPTWSNIQMYNMFAEKGYYCVAYPSTLAIFLTTNCNLRCFICPREGHKGQNLNIEHLPKLKQAIRFARTIDLTGTGEAFIYPQFEEALQYIYSLNSGEVIQITTNGTRLSEKYGELLKGHLRHMTISLNAATEATYNRDMVHGDFTWTIGAIRSFLAVIPPNDRDKIELHFVAHTNNFHELPAFVELAHTLGIRTVSFGNYLISTRDRVPYSLLHIKQEWNNIVDQTRKLAEELQIIMIARKFFEEQERPRTLCVSPFEEVFILTDGEILPCCYAGSPSLGNVFETCFEDVWFGTAYRRLREKRDHPACRTCTPFMPFDSFYAHFSGGYRVSEEFKEIEQLFSSDKEICKESECLG